MTNTLSRILAAIELAALLIPASGRAVFVAVLIWLDPFGKVDFPCGLFVLLVIAIAAMAGLWRILAAFIFKGADCFQDIHSRLVVVGDCRSGDGSRRASLEPIISIAVCAA